MTPLAAILTARLRPARSDGDRGEPQRSQRSHSLGMRLLVPLTAVFACLAVIAMVAVAAPYAIWVLKQAADGLPRELDEAALIDGATPPQLFRLVFLPLIVPSMIAVDRSDLTPIVWYIGITPSVTSPTRMRYCATCATAAMRSARCRRGTPLGLPVVPEV